MGREFELKYRADKAQLEEIAAVYGPFREIAMETTYYDAPSGVFSRLHWTLRRRLENGVSVCTLKSNLPDGSRGEWETECGCIGDAVETLVRQGAPGALLTLTAQGVTEVCAARFTRLAKTVETGDALVELALCTRYFEGGRLGRGIFSVVDAIFGIALSLVCIIASRRGKATQFGAF